MKVFICENRTRLKNKLFHRCLQYVFFVDVKDEFAKINCQNPNCVVLGDAEDELTYENLNHALRVLIDNPLIVSLGFG